MADALAVDATLERAPFAKPPFTISDLKRAIPATCFKKSTMRSFSYLLSDLVMIVLLVYMSTWIDRIAFPSVLRWGVLWPTYWFWCGAFATGVWVVAHECGHGAFSNSKAINDTVGFVFHSLLLVPYYSWKHSHRRHHSNTANVAKDEVFVPKTEPSIVEGDSPITHSAPFRAIQIVITLTMGWPMYLLTNTSGRPYPRWASHFFPYSPIFSKRERLEVLLSDVGLAVVVYALALLGMNYGWVWLVKTYVVPYLIVNHWLVMITLLQHTHPGLPHYTDEEWDWLRGALGTVDRSYGVLDIVFHHIADTHVTHHLFSMMPHYHAQEATKAVKEVLGDYYKFDNRNVFKALWEDFYTCRYVAPDKPGEGVLWYRA